MARALVRARAEIDERELVHHRRGTGAAGGVALLDRPPADAPPPSPPSRPRRATDDPDPSPASGDGVSPTRVAPSYSTRRNINPAGRRRRIALLGFVVLLVLGMIAAALLLAPGHARVPNLHGMTRGRVNTVLRRAGLKATFAHQYSGAREGTAVGQSPRRGTRVKDGSDVTVTLSAGPAPVTVPSVVGRTSSDAVQALDGDKLHPVVDQVPAPGVPTGQVTGESPAAGSRLRPGSTVTVSAAEAPRWRSLTAFSGLARTSSVPFRIRGSHWRMVYDMSYRGTCALILFCSGPNATVTNVHTSQTVQQFSLDEGTGRIWTFSSGPGVYQITITPGSDNAHFTVQVQDRY